MRTAILSDIHSNLPALEAVLEDVESVDPEQIWCLGDVVGYGAQPVECTTLVRERCDLSLVGNHDLAVLGNLDLATFSTAAAAAVEWTQECATPETLDYLRELEPADTTHEVALYHASPRDPVWEYVLWPEQAAECMAEQAARVSLIGHSHVALFFVAAEAGENGRLEARGAQAGAGTDLDLREGTWLVNPGSVGQPRDGDPRASWLELDTEHWNATYHRVEYEIERAAAAIERTELPATLARRLYVGQ